MQSGLECLENNAESEAVPEIKIKADPGLKRAAEDVNGQIVYGRWSAKSPGLLLIRNAEHLRNEVKG